MARNKQKRSSGSPDSSNSFGSSSRRDDDSPDVPDGFTINAGRERGEGWLHKEEGNELLGRLLGRQTYKNKRGKTRAFYQVRLIKSCRAAIENPDFNEDADEDETNTPTVIETLEEGQVVNVDEFKKLEDLEPFTKDGGVYDVWFVIGPKIDIGDDQTMWSLAAGPRLRVIEKPSNPL